MSAYTLACGGLSERRACAARQIGATAVHFNVLSISFQ